MPAETCKELPHTVTKIDENAPTNKLNLRKPLKSGDRPRRERPENTQQGHDEGSTGGLDHDASAGPSALHRGDKLELKEKIGLARARAKHVHAGTDEAKKLQISPSLGAGCGSGFIGFRALREPRPLAWHWFRRACIGKPSSLSSGRFAKFLKYSASVASFLSHSVADILGTTLHTAPRSFNPTGLKLFWVTLAIEAQ